MSAHKLNSWHRVGLNLYDLSGGKYTMHLGSPKLRAAVFAVCATLLAADAFGQATPAGSSRPGPSNVDLFVGGGDFQPLYSHVDGFNWHRIPGGITGGVTGYFNRTVGLQAQLSKYPDDPDYCFGSIEGGPVFRHQMGRWVPFAHVLGGGAQVGPPYGDRNATHTQPCSTWGWIATGGVGLDIVVPALHNHLAIRPVEADYSFSYLDYNGKQYTFGSGQLYALRLTAGLVLRLGDMQPPLPATYGCVATPVNVYPGDPVTVTGSSVNLEVSKKLKPVYYWSTTGGQVTGTSETATVSTVGLAPGDYTIHGKVDEGKLPTEHGDCTASFRVNAFEPPSIACSASPDSILPGGIATVSAQARSPQNRPLNVSYSASAGRITGVGPTANFSAVDVSPSIVNIACNAVDDLGKTAAATTTITIVAPPAPVAAPLPVTRALCSLSFERDKARPVRVDNEAKGCLDDVALALNRESDATLVIVGRHDPSETPDAAAQRTLNVKQYLTVEKGIDPSRIDVRTGEATGRTVDTVLVPAGATWDPGKTTTFDPGSIKRKGQPYGKTTP
jgi:hypothetical protein